MTDESASPAELYCRDEGAGPVLVFLHGAGSSHTVWNALWPRLVGSFRLLGPDLRGHGRSAEPPGSHYSFPEFEADVIGLLDAKAIPRAHVIGLSAGALLALSLALDHPERLRSLVMVSGAAYTDGHTRAIADRWSEVYGKEGPDPFALRLLKDLYYPEWIEAHLDYADEVRRQAHTQDFGPAARWARAMKGFDERNRLASLQTPTLIVQAMDDAVVDASHGRILRQTIPGAQIRILAETGHMVPVERPEETADAIGSFARSVEDRAAEPGARAPSHG